RGSVSPLPEGGKRAVVRADVFWTVHEGRESGPVDVVALGHTDDRQRVGEHEHVAHGHLEANTSEHTSEGDDCGIHEMPRVSAGSGDGRAYEVADAVALDAFGVLSVFEDAAQRGGHGGVAELALV